MNARIPHRHFFRQPLKRDPISEIKKLRRWASQQRDAHAAAVAAYESSHRFGDVVDPVDDAMAYQHRMDAEHFGGATRILVALEARLK